MSNSMYNSNIQLKIPSTYTTMNSCTHVSYLSIKFSNIFSCIHKSGLSIMSLLSPSVFEINYSKVKCKSI